MVEELDKLLELSTKICSDTLHDSEKLSDALLELNSAISDCVQSCKNDIYRINEDLMRHAQSIREILGNYP